MKKVLCLFLAGCLVMGLTACKGEDEEVENALVCTLTQDGSTMTMKMDAKGDVITRIKQEAVVDTTTLSPEKITMIEQTALEMSAVYGEVEGVEYSLETQEGQIVENIVIPTDEETLKLVVEKELLPVEADGATKLSLEATRENMAASGWVIEEKGEETEEE